MKYNRRSLNKNKNPNSIPVITENLETPYIPTNANAERAFHFASKLFASCKVSHILGDAVQPFPTSSIPSVAGPWTQVGWVVLKRKEGRGFDKEPN